MRHATHQKHGQSHMVAANSSQQMNSVQQNQQQQQQQHQQQQQTVSLRPFDMMNTSVFVVY